MFQGKQFHLKQNQRSIQVGKYVIRAELYWQFSRALNSHKVGNSDMHWYCSLPLYMYMTAFIEQSQSLQMLLPKLSAQTMHKTGCVLCACT